MDFKSLFKVAIFSVLPLTGCATFKGPILGDWSGYQPLSTPQGQVAVDLVMFGKLKDDRGAFRAYEQMEWTAGNSADSSIYLNGRWTAKNVIVKGKTWRNYTLTGTTVVFPTYVLTPDNILVPAASDGSPDMSAAGWGCCRLAPRVKTSYGFGRP